jgi:hypothetical protein
LLNSIPVPQRQGSLSPTPPWPGWDDDALTVRVQFENDRMDVQHYIWKVMFKVRNHFAPLEDPRKILDVGCGTGVWMIEMGALHLLLDQDTCWQ